MPHLSILGSFLSFTGLGSGKNVAPGLLLVWLAVVYDVWNSCNDVIFAGGTSIVELLVDMVKLSSWKWFMSKSFVSLCFFYEWEAQVVMCWSR